MADDTEPVSTPDHLPEAAADRVRAVVIRVVAELDDRASVEVTETDEEIRCVIEGEDVGLVIGKHGSTIDALQHLAARSTFVGDHERKRVVVDAGGYREKRAQALQREADRAVEDALSFKRAVELEPMTAQERKVVHDYLSERVDVQTHSEGDEPDRRLVVTPVGA